jgi:hypothetical protein
MKGLEKLPMRLVVSQLIEHANWASRSWVEATMHAIGEAIRESSSADSDATRRLERAETVPNPDEKEDALYAALQSCRDGDELRSLALKFLKLREQYRPIWSSELAVPELKLRAHGGLIAAHRR